ncbi:MAG: pitrilysin family protein [Arcanobacterium sp.]|nr:pitrilysin family protein [Arcanobacterium sp.]
MEFQNLSFENTPASNGKYFTQEWSEGAILGKRSVLPGGVRVLSEYVPGQRSVSVSYWIGAGSRDENPGAEGSTHFLEHLLFKGTSTRSSQDISQLSDFLGGAINAATARNYTCYYGRVFASDMPQLLDLLTDMVTSATLSPEEMEIERGVILEELASAADRGASEVMDALLPLAIGENTLALPIGGTPETVKALDHAHLLEHYQSKYRPDELIVTAAGDLNHEELCALVEALLRSYGWNLEDGVPPAAPRRGKTLEFTNGGNLVVPHPSRQSTVMIALPGLTLGSEHDDTLTLLDYILGGGTSSRLFQEVREKRGLAYSVGSWDLSWNEGGLFGLEAACSEEVAQEVADVMLETFEHLAVQGVTQEEVDIAFNQRRAQLVFSSETNGYRRNRLGYAELFYGQLRSMDESLRRSREVTPQMIQGLAEDIVNGPRSVAYSRSTS